MPALVASQGGGVCSLQMVDNNEFSIPTTIWHAYHNEGDASSSFVSLHIILHIVYGSHIHCWLRINFNVIHNHQGLGTCCVLKGTKILHFGAYDFTLFNIPFRFNVNIKVSLISSHKNCYLKLSNICFYHNVLKKINVHPQLVSEHTLQLKFEQRIC